MLLSHHRKRKLISSQVLDQMILVQKRILPHPLVASSFMHHQVLQVDYGCIFWLLLANQNRWMGHVEVAENCWVFIGKEPSDNSAHEAAKEGRLSVEVGWESFQDFYPNFRGRLACQLKSNDEQITFQFPLPNL